MLNTQEVWSQVCKIIDYMLENRRTVLSLSDIIDQDLVLHNERIILNTTESPNRAKGAFILLKKHRFRYPHKYLFNPYINLLTKFREKDLQTPINLAQSDTRIQDYFERRFLNAIEGFLRENKIDIKVKKVCNDHMNEYDVIMFGSYGTFTIEIKSDVNPGTGNVSLEIMRDIKAASEERAKEFNIGSIIKTGADVWYIYYYENTKEGYTLADIEIFYTPQMKAHVFSLFKQMVENLSL